MATTSNTYTGNGTNKLFSITFPYLNTSDIDVYLNGVLQTITTQYSFANATTIEFVTAPSAGAAVLLDRSTDDGNLQATFFPGSSIKAADLNNNFDQFLYLGQESSNIASTATSTANTALTNSNTAISTANSAVVTANGAASTANQAIIDSAAAVVTANGIAATANTALSNSTAAVSTANTANSNASIAITTSNNAIVLASQAISLGQKAFIDLYNLAVGSPGSKVIDLGNLTSGCVSDYFTGEDGGTSNYNCSIGCSLTNLGTV